ncbi:MAG: radical SAM protein [Bacteroidales bacterium]|jgi:radical SAM enzyme (rSAM/lipoprotein system)|nr:radical SAM protein [Bacteroidales bacterium]
MDIGHIGLRQRLQLEVFRQMRHNQARLHPLRQLFWECTMRCNLHCRHCGSDCKATALHPDMPADDFLRAVDSVRPHVNPHEVMIVITGGEPLMRDDLADVGRVLHDRGFSWGIVTNGWLLDEVRLRELLAAGMTSLTISLDGLRDDHDWMRGRQGSFDRTWRAITLLCRTRGLTWDVDTCVNRRNFPHLDEMRQALESAGVGRWRLLTVFPMGRAASDPDMIVTGDEFRALLDYIDRQRTDFRDGRTTMLCYYGCEGFLGAYEGKTRNHFFHCDAGISVASVLIDGSISACSSIRADYHQGNIYRDDLWTVWQNGFKPYRDHTWMRRLEPCADCKMWRYCEGGGMHQRDEGGQLMLCRYHDATIQL